MNSFLNDSCSDTEATVGEPETYNQGRGTRGEYLTIKEDPDIATESFFKSNGDPPTSNGQPHHFSSKYFLKLIIMSIQCLHISMTTIVFSESV